jgi:hypothetical protein
MLDWLLALWGGVGGLVQGRVGLRHGASIRYTHCDTPGPCVTPARECKYRPHQRRSNACRGRHRGQPAPAPARVTLGAYRGPLYAHAGRRSRCVTRDTRATLGAMRPQHRGRYAHAGPVPAGGDAPTTPGAIRPRRSSPHLQKSQPNKSVGARANIPVWLAPTL